MDKLNQKQNELQQLIASEENEELKQRLEKQKQDLDKLSDNIETEVDMDAEDNMEKIVYEEPEKQVDISRKPLTDRISNFVERNVNRIASREQDEEGEEEDLEDLEEQAEERKRNTLPSGYDISSFFKIEDVPTLIQEMRKVRLLNGDQIQRIIINNFLEYPK